MKRVPSSRLPPENGEPPENMPAALKEQLEVPCDQVESWQLIKQTRGGALYLVQLRTQLKTTAFGATSPTMLVGTGSLAEDLQRSYRRTQFVGSKGKSVTVIVSTGPRRIACRQPDTSSSLERFIGDRYAALTELPEEEMLFAAELWPQLQPRAAWLGREQMLEALVDREVAGGVAEDEAQQRAFVRLRGWTKSDCVISVKVPGEYFPLFQFGNDGEPLPVITRLNGLWPPRTSGLAKAAWLLAPNQNLRDAVPADLLATDPDRVVQALELEHFVVH